MSLVALGASDVAGGFKSWRMWWMLAKNDVVRRYRRSRIGQWWLTLSMAAMIGGMSLVYSGLFNTPMADYLPYLGTGLVLWGVHGGEKTIHWSACVCAGAGGVKVGHWIG